MNLGSVLLWGSYRAPSSKYDNNRIYRLTNMISIFMSLSGFLLATSPMYKMRDFLKITPNRLGVLWDGVRVMGGFYLCMKACLEAAARLSLFPHGPLPMSKEAPPSYIFRLHLCNNHTLRPFAQGATHGTRIE